MTPKEIITLDADEAAKFESSMRKRSAIAEAGDAMARTFSAQMKEALTEINDAYLEVAEKHGLDLSTQRYEFDSIRKCLVLTQIALKGNL